MNWNLVAQKIDLDLVLQDVLVCLSVFLSQHQHHVFFCRDTFVSCVSVFVVLVRQQKPAQNTNTNNLQGHPIVSATTETIDGEE